MHRLRRLERTAKRLMRMGLVYLLGGARRPGGIAPPQREGEAWTDCSGFVLYLLAVAGIRLKIPDGWTGTLQSEGQEGESPYLTVYLKEPEQTEGHTILRLRHHPHWRRRLGLGWQWRWVECGGLDNPQRGDGPTYFHPTDARIAEFTVRRHFPEFDAYCRRHP